MSKAETYTYTGFSFMYDGKPWRELLAEARVEERKKGENKYAFEYSVKGGLVVTREVEYFPKYDAERWFLCFENRSHENSGILSEINDCDRAFRFYSNKAEQKPGFARNASDARIYHVAGSNLSNDEYTMRPFDFPQNSDKTFSSSGGRSCQGDAPYFNVCEDNHGVIIAVGWTGQWKARFTSDENRIRVRTGIEALSFYLKPGERVRTSSVIVMPYDNGQKEGQIGFRRLLKEQFSLIGSPGRPETGPLCTSSWGSMPSEKMVERIESVSKNNIGAEYYWVDAGWYGHSQTDCPDEFTGDWATQTGSWNINEKYHPDGFLNVTKALEEAKLKFLLWFEPERALRGTDWPTEHPEWFLERNSEDQTLLLDLGNENAFNAVFEMLSKRIEELNIQCYRQDFNMDPLEFWRNADEENRNGIHEIKHINGLYRLWDMLLEKFPNLIIDNCASGGRRNDYEMLSRSIPLWRSDMQCIFDADPEISQTQTAGISSWLPYHGTGIGILMGDTYRARSCYSPSMTTAFWSYEFLEFEESQPLNWVRKTFAEYKRARPYFSCDYYPLTTVSSNSGTWCAWQFHDPETNSGIIQAFRRADSPMKTAEFALDGLRKHCDYSFEDADSGVELLLNSDELAEKGLEITIEEKRSSRLLFYKLK